MRLVRRNGETNMNTYKRIIDLQAQALRDNAKPMLVLKLVRSEYDRLAADLCGLDAGGYKELTQFSRFAGMFVVIDDSVGDMMIVGDRPKKEAPGDTYVMSNEELSNEIRAARAALESTTLLNGLAAGLDIASHLRALQAVQLERAKR